MKLHIVLLIGALGAMAQSGSPLAEPPAEGNGTAAAPDVPPITEGIIGASASSPDAAPSSTSSTTPSGNGTDPSSSASGAAHVNAPLDLARYAGPAAVVVGAVGAGLAVVL